MSAFTLQMERARLHARLHSFARKVELARVTIGLALERMRAPYVAFSGGKDSSVALHLVRSVRPETPAVWGDDEWHLPETLALIDATPNLQRIASRIQHSEWFTSWDTPEPQLPAGTIWIDTAHGGGLQTFARSQGYDGVFLGLRADENSRRRVHLRTLGTLYYANNHQVWQCNPLAWWSTMDVWAYISTQGVAYNRAYDRLAEIGVPPDRQRVGPLSQARVLGYGQMAVLKRGWPDLYRAFVERYPETGAYV